MLKIGLLSDTHAYLHKSILDFFIPCNEIWHAGDWGSLQLYEELKTLKPIRGVWGNIDGYDLRKILPQTQRFTIEGIDVLLTHIGGYPGKYDKSIKDILYQNPPKLFICGHSHILKVMYDKKLKMLHINPGAAGKYGFQIVSTAVRFDIDTDRIENLEILEITI